MTSIIEKARCWFLHSGIQEATGGVARYHRLDAAANLPVSNEITGYAVSALSFFHQRGGDSQSMDRALHAARFLRDEAWDPASSAYPFEPGSNLAYFFDTGIIARGLLAAWRATGDETFRGRARDAALSLAFDFLDEDSFHPVISLPEKQPLGPESRWSRRPGCYQLKSALIWRELGDPDARRMFDKALANALRNHEAFLDEEPDPQKLMDRLHAYCYFLEALLWAVEHAEAREALDSGTACVTALLLDIAPEFERSDVWAQLLRVRLIAHRLGALALDIESACEEARRIAQFQISDSNPGARGGFWFGCKGGIMMPFVNPVSTAFCAQALALWQDHQEDRWSFELHQLI